jgi:hypothetical protein
MKTNAMIAYPISFSTNYFYSRIKYIPKFEPMTNHCRRMASLAKHFFQHPRVSNLRVPLQPRIDHTTARPKSSISQKFESMTNHCRRMASLAKHFIWHPWELNLRAPLQPRVDSTTAGRRGCTRHPPPHLPHFLKSSPIFIIVCLFCRPSRMHKSRQNWSGYIHPDRICPNVHIRTVFKSGLWVI